MIEPQKPSAILWGAFDLINAPYKWTMAAYARRKGGEACTPRSSRACRFCVEGALWRASGLETAGAVERSAAYGFLRRSALRFKLDGWDDDVLPSIVNDFRDHTTARRMLRSAARMAERAGQ